MKVDKLVPKRVTNQGRKPSISGKALTRKVGSKQTIKGIWTPQKLSFDEHEQRFLMAAALELGIKTAFQMHVYTFGGLLYLQQSGGPTGTSATCPVAKGRMNRWWRKVKSILGHLNLDVPLVFI